VTVTGGGAATPPDKDFMEIKHHHVFHGGVDCYDVQCDISVATIQFETYVYCYAAVACYCLTRITFPSQGFSENERLFHNTLTVLK